MMQADAFAVDVIWLAGGILAVIVFLIYYLKFDLPTKKSRKLLKGLYYDPVKFRKKAVAQTFEYYDDKISKIIFAWFVPTALSVVIPAALIPAPYNLIVTVAGMIVSFFFIMYYKTLINEQERARNINKPFGSVIAHYPDTGDNNELWRRIENKGEILLDDSQRAIVVDQLIETAKELPSFKKGNYDLPKIKKMWLERMKMFRAYRLRVGDEFRILFVTPHLIEDSKTQDTKSMIDETVHVDVQQIPMFSLYAGTTRRVFSSKDKKDRSIFLDKTMGIYVNMYDIKSRDDDMMKGGHVALSKTDALLGEVIHLYEQRQSSAKEMTKTLRDLEKSNEDYEQADFDSKAEAHRITQGVKGIMDALGSFSKPSHTKTDVGVLIVAITIFFLMGTLLGWTWGLLAARG